MIKNVIFDMGNVLLAYDPQIPLNLFCAAEEEKQVIRRELFCGPEWVQGDLGNMTADERFRSVGARIPQAMHPAFYDCFYKWYECLTPIRGAKEFCTSLKQKGYGIYVLSNASEEFYDYFPDFAPLSFFDGVVVSSDIHLIKPDERIYRYLLDKYGLTPQECLFIDDLKPNVEAAGQVGIQAEVFLGNYDEIEKKYGF